MTERYPTTDVDARRLRRRRLGSLAVVAAAVLLAVAVVTLLRPAEIVDPEVAAADPDFHIQGEYVGVDARGHRVGGQVVALGRGRFDAVVYRGGLPGAGWSEGDDRIVVAGRRLGEEVLLGDGQSVGLIAAGVLRLTDGATALLLTRTERSSPTLGAAPPPAGEVLFDGRDTTMFPGGNVTAAGTLVAGVASRPLPASFRLHLEFRLSYMPAARGQFRSNSGVFLHDCYEVQVLDSFGQTVQANRCGGVYGRRGAEANLCLPPLAWQTYDIEFRGPHFDAAGVKVRNARVTVRHNGVAIHRGLELTGGSPGRQAEGPGPRPLFLQGHGCRVQYRNIWIAGPAAADEGHQALPAAVRAAAEAGVGG